MRTVIDTNVFVSSFFGGNPRKVIDLWKNGNVTLCLSRAILDEYVEVFKRLDLEEEPEMKELLEIFAGGHGVLFTMDTPKLDVILQDPDDNKFIECAVALKALFIVSGDKELLKVSDYMGIRILTPRDFLSLATGS